MNSFSPIKRWIMVILAVGLLAFFIYVKFFADEEAKLFLGAKHIDKLAHLGGGIFLAMVFERQSRSQRLASFLLVLGAVVLGWEAYEFFFDADTAYFYSINPDLWLLDALGDVVAATLGGYGYWIFFVNVQTSEKIKASRRLAG